MSSDGSRSTGTSCPRCGTALTPIAYGFPGPELSEAAERGDVVLGGCTIYDGMPTSRCTSCGTDAGRRGLDRPTSGWLDPERLNLDDVPGLADDA